MCIGHLIPPHLSPVGLCVMFSSPAYSVNEGDSVSLVLILEQEIGVPVRVDIAFNDGTAVCEYTRLA